MPKLFNHKYFNTSGLTNDQLELMSNPQSEDGLYKLEFGIVNSYVIDKSSPYFKSILRFHYGDEQKKNVR